MCVNVVVNCAINQLATIYFLLFSNSEQRILLFCTINISYTMSLSYSGIILKLIQVHHAQRLLDTIYFFLNVDDYTGKVINKI
jgi:hypothetical protein